MDGALAEAWAAKKNLIRKVPTFEESVRAQILAKIAETFDQERIPADTSRQAVARIGPLSRNHEGYKCDLVLGDRDAHLASDWSVGAQCKSHRLRASILSRAVHRATSERAFPQDLRSICNTR